MKWKAELLSAVVLLALTGCGGGGGGSSEPAPAPTPPSNFSLVPAAPVVGATLHADAATLRPLRNGAVWRYRGTQSSPLVPASPLAYTTTTTQASTATDAVTETFTNLGNEGPDSQALGLVAGSVGYTESIDFAGKGTPETVRYVELRSPVRTGDQITMLDKRYTDTAIDNDGDGRPDTLDVALYGRVIGAETLRLPGLPVLNTVRVDTVLRVRVTSSRTGVPGDVVEATQQSWYAVGIGIVRQRTVSPVGTAGGIEVVDEQLESWDGVSAGFGAMPTQDAVQPATAGAVAGQTLSSSQLRVFAFPGHALVFSDLLGDPSRTMASRFDLRGQVIDGRVIEGLRVVSFAKMAQLNGGVVLLDTPPAGSLTTLRLTRFATDGALNGAVGAVSIDLAGTRLAPVVGAFAVAGDGDRFWLLFGRGYRDTDPQFSIRNEFVLRAYSANGEPLTSEIVLPQGIARLPVLTADRGRLLLSWIGPEPGNAVQYASLDAVTGLLSVRTLVTDLPGSNSFVTPLLLDTGGALLWPAALGSGASQIATAGVRLDASFTALRSGADLTSELLTELPTYDSEVAAPAAQGARLVLATRDGPVDFNGQPQGNGVARVSWFDPSSSTPLKATALNAVSFEVGTGLLPRAQAVYADRTLVFSGGAGGGRLRSTLVWLNDGNAR